MWRSFIVIRNFTGDAWLLVFFFSPGGTHSRNNTTQQKKKTGKSSSFTFLPTFLFVIWYGTCKFCMVPFKSIAVIGLEWKAGCLWCTTTIQQRDLTVSKNSDTSKTSSRDDWPFLVGDIEINVLIWISNRFSMAFSSPWEQLKGKTSRSIRVVRLSGTADTHQWPWVANFQLHIVVPGNAFT